MSFPSLRMRRLRKTPAMREIMQSVKVHPSNLIYPIFVDENAKKPVPITAMPDYHRLPIKQVIAEVPNTFKAVKVFISA